MSNLIIPGAAAAAGYFIGGPTGAQLGWLLGSALSSKKNQETTQPTIGDLTTTTSQYGTQIPYVIGKQRVAGNIIWADSKKSYKTTTGGSGKGGLISPSTPEVTTVGYTVSMLIAICQGPILGVTRVWNAGKLIINTPGAPLIGQLYLGDMTQTPDPTYESIVGAGNAPAYRGLSYISLTNFDLGTSGVIPQFSFEVVRGQIL